MGADKAKQTVLGIEIARDELAFRIMQKATGLNPPLGMTWQEAREKVDRAAPGMWEVFRDQADAAVKYFHECINAAKQPS